MTEKKLIKKCHASACAWLVMPKGNAVVAQKHEEGTWERAPNLKIRSLGTSDAPPIMYRA